MAAEIEIQAYGDSYENSDILIGCCGPDCEKMREFYRRSLWIFGKNFTRRRMQDYIEKNRAEEISLLDLARASLFSPWYSYRLFRDCIGLTPTEYIRKYRLTQAAKQLQSGESH